MFRPEYIKKCGKSGIIAACNYKNDNFVITRGRQNVASESTPSGLLTSKVPNVTRCDFLYFELVVPDYRFIK